VCLEMRLATKPGSETPKDYEAWAAEVNDARQEGQRPVYSTAGGVSQAVGAGWQDCLRVHAASSLGRRADVRRGRRSRGLPIPSTTSSVSARSRESSRPRRGRLLFGAGRSAFRHP